MATEFEAVIGLEIHCQLATQTKIFCGCPAGPPEGKTVADIAPNSNTCPICTGHPGTLPVLNRQAVEYAVMAGLATQCRINAHNIFARKNYFYPDLPKGYQISQYDRPICEDGRIEIQTGQGKRTITVQRIHMEEDAGKSTHHAGYSLVNLNRTGVPLIEIVSAPEMKTPEEAGAYMRTIHSIMTAIGVTDGNLQEGNFRCDANVSVMPKGSKVFGTRTETKNVNSFRFVEKAIEYEIHRQIEVIKSGGKVVLETRLFDSDRGITVSMRSKEEAHDYRYFPDPDLIDVKIDSAWIEKIRAAIPELPEQKLTRYTGELGLSDYDAGVLTSSKSMSDFFETTIALLKTQGLETKSAAKSLANLLTGEVAKLLNEAAIEITACALKPEHLSQTVLLVSQNAVSSTAAKKILSTAFKSGEAVQAIVDREGLKQVSDLSALEPAIVQVLASFPAQVAEFKSGKEKVIGFLVGQAMKATGGKANPAMLQELIRKKMAES